MATFTPQIQLREKPLVPADSALLFIDCQNYNCHKDGAEYSNGNGGKSVCYLQCPLQDNVVSHMT